MSIIAYEVEAVGHDEACNDFGFVNIMYRWGNEKSWEDNCEIIDVMWAAESVYGPPAPGAKVGDFIKTWMCGPQYGVFTHRTIAAELIQQFTGLTFKELSWHKNPLEITLKNGKPRKQKPKWLPEIDADLVYLYSNAQIDVDSQSAVKTDFFVVHRKSDNDNANRGTWFMCTEEAAKRLKKQKYKNLEIKKAVISDTQTALVKNKEKNNAWKKIPIVVTIGEGYCRHTENHKIGNISRFSDSSVAGREFNLSGINVHDKLWYLFNKIYAIDIIGDVEDNICFDDPELAVFEDGTLNYFKQHYEWIETKNKVHIYFPEVCLVFSCFGKKKDSKGKRIRLFDREQKKHIEEKYLKL